MPGRKRTYRKRPQYKRRPKAAPKTVARPLRIGIPYCQLLKLRYTDQFLLDPPSAGVCSDHVFRINSIYDPDFTGVGHQPRYFDQYFGNEDGSGMYKHFVVLGAKVTARMSNSDTARPVNVGMRISDSSTAIINPSDYMEAANARTKQLGVVSSGSSTKTIVMKWSAKKWFGKPNVTTERDLQGSNVDNPNEVAYLHVFTENPFADNVGVYTVITIDFIVQARSPVLAAES